MNMFLSFESPLEFLLRYTVITGVIIAMIGTALCLLARKENKANNKSKTWFATVFGVGLCLILFGLIVIALPIENTFYVG